MPRIRRIWSGGSCSAPEYGLRRVERRRAEEAEGRRAQGGRDVEVWPVEADGLVIVGERGSEEVVEDEDETGLTPRREGGRSGWENMVGIARREQK